MSLFDGEIFQKYWERLLAISLHKMNIGCGDSVGCSGELQVLNFVLKKIKGNHLVIFDVGANTGEYTRKLIQVLGNRGTIYSFEPSNKTFEILSQNIKNKNVRLFNFGFGENNEEVAFYSDQAGSGLASVYKRQLKHFNIYLKEKEVISLKTLDSFTKEQEINHIHLLKLDVEGHEFKVLLGAKNLIDAQSIDTIQFEFGGCDIDSRIFFQDFFYLLSPNYRIFRILKNGFYAIDNYKEIYEQFATTNFLAVSKKI